MNVVAIPHPMSDKSHFKEIADQVLEAIHHFDPKEWGLPSLKKEEIN